MWLDLTILFLQQVRLLPSLSLLLAVMVVRGGGAIDISIRLCCEAINYTSIAVSNTNSIHNERRINKWSNRPRVHVARVRRTLNHRYVFGSFIASIFFLCGSRTYIKINMGNIVRSVKCVRRFSFNFNVFMVFLLLFHSHTHTWVARTPCATKRKKKSDSWRGDTALRANGIRCAMGCVSYLASGCYKVHHEGDGNILYIITVCVLA